jgi:hypothetical protein
MTTNSSAANTKLTWIAIALSIVAIALSVFALYRSGADTDRDPRRIACCRRSDQGLGRWNDATQSCEGSC